jgi:CHASE2 domain-containing sensor protein
MAKNVSPTDEPPYLSFLGRDQFDSVTLPANDVICASSQSLGWRPCEQKELNPQVQRLIRGKVVVIGDDYPGRDRFETVVGDIPGYVLQANYIESLLDDRIFLPVSEVVNSIAGILIFICVEYMFWRFHGIRAPWRVGLVFICVALVVYLVVMFGGYYFNPTTLSILAVLNSRIIDLVLKPK